MRTFKPKPARDARSANPWPRAFFRQSQHVSLIADQHQALGNKRVQQIFEPRAGDLSSGVTANGTTRISYDFSRLPIHATAHAKPSRLTIGSQTNKHEQEAERAADRVLNNTESIALAAEHGAFNGRTIDRPGHRQPAIEANAISQELGAHSNGSGNGQPLSSQQRAFFEPQFGHDFSQVRIHSDERSAAMADSLNAEAFTVGNDIYFGSGKPRTITPDRLLAHELAHVAQQSQMGPTLQPKLKITGSPTNVSRAIALLNSGLQQYRVSVDGSGQVSITENFVELPPKPEQQALADRLRTVINDPKDVNMTVSAGSKTVGGSYNTGDFDIADLETYGVAGLIHEIEEQYQKQVKGLGFGSQTTGAHGEAIKAESEVRGAQRGEEKVVSKKSNADGTMDAVVEIPHTFPDGKIKTLVVTVKSNNFVSAVWK